MHTRTAFIATLVALTILLPRPQEGSAAARAPLWVCSDGKGTISLFWLPPLGDWPSGGFRIERIMRGRAALLADGVRPGRDDAAMAQLAPGDAADIRDLDAKIWTGTLTDEEKALSISRLGRRAAVDAVYGRALGVRFTDASHTPGKRTYRVVAQDLGGKTIFTLESHEVDPSRRTEPPQKPSRAAAAPRDGGVVVSWSEPPASAVAPVVAYRIDRIASPGKPVALTKKPFAFDRVPAGTGPEYLDTSPPSGRITYEIRAVDIFGRASQPARAGLLVAPGPRAASARAEAEPESARPPQAEPALLKPPETPAPATELLPAQAAAGEDSARAPETEQAPTAEIRNPPGRESATTAAARTQEEIDPGAATAEGTKSELAVPLERNETYRRWTAAAPGTFEVPEESAAPAAPEEPEAVPASPEPPLARNEMYRRMAAGLEPAEAQGGNRDVEPQESAATPGEATEARPPADDDGRPGPPRIMSISGAGGRVVIDFEPAAPAERAHGFRLLRGSTPASEGAIVGRPIPGDARRFEDATVSPGQSYWYRVVALGEDERPGEPSAPRWVKVGSR